MVKMLVISLILGLLLVGSVFIYNLPTDELEEAEDNTKEFSGPVPLGYDLEHFRKTGETIREEIN